VYCVCGGDPRLRPLLPKTLETPPKNNNNRSTHKFTEPKREGLAVCVGVYTVPVCILYYYYMCTLLYYCYYYIRLGGSKDGKQVKQKPHRRRMIHRCETHINILYVYSNNNNKYNGDNNCASELRRRRRDGSAPHDFRATRF